MEEKLLKLSIHPKTDANNKRSFGYDVQIDKWHLGRGVTDINLDMSANKRPKVTITCYPEIMDIDVETLLNLEKKTSLS